MKSYWRASVTRDFASVVTVPIRPRSGFWYGFGMPALLTSLKGLYSRPMFLHVFVDVAAFPKEFPYSCTWNRYLAVGNRVGDVPRLMRAITALPGACASWIESFSLIWQTA